MKLGVIVCLDPKSDITQKLKEVGALGFSSCQISCWNTDCYTEENATRILSALAEYGLTISTFWAGWTGKAAWNFYEGPTTLGIVPQDVRERRVCELKAGSDFAKRLGVGQVATHVGFLPESPAYEGYTELVAAIKEVALYCKNNGQYFLFETGQETPVTILRMIEDIGLDNLGVNLDPANLILYGKANPVDALDVIGKYVRDVHGKDGMYPTNGRELGKETPLGEGKVDFPRFIARLKALGYDGAITIEREISGEEQTRDILSAKTLLEKLI